MRSLPEWVGRNDVLLEVAQAKNPRQVRLYFALLSFAVDHAINPETGEMLFLSDEQAKDAIKIATGAASPVVDPLTGRTFWNLHSVRKMDSAQFQDFFDRAVYIITERWMPEGTVPDEVRAEIIRMIEPVTPYTAHPRERRPRQASEAPRKPAVRRNSRRGIA